MEKRFDLIVDLLDCSSKSMAASQLPSSLQNCSSALPKSAFQKARRTIDEKLALRFLAFVDRGLRLKTT